MGLKSGKTLEKWWIFLFVSLMQKKTEKTILSNTPTHISFCFVFSVVET